MMPSTPGRLIRGRTMCTFNKVPLEKDYLQREKSGYSPDLEPLQDGKQMQQNGNVFVDEGAEYINFGLEEQMEVRGFVHDKFRATMSWIMIAVSLGALRLVFHWWPHWMLYATHKRASLDIAEKILVIERYQDKHESYYVKNIKVISMDSVRSEFLNGDCDDANLDELEDSKLPVHVGNGYFQGYDSIRIFKCKKIAYIWDMDRQKFVKLRGLDQNVTAAALHSMKGLSATQQFLRKVVYGANEIVVPMRGFVALLCLEVLNPFYIFQIFSFCLWIADDYLYYALCILAMSLTSVFMAVIQTRRNQINLWSRVFSRDFARVVRSGTNKEVDVPTDELVPGDVLVVPSHGCVMYCDAVLITGNCIVNESMLTGESVPVTKIPICDSANICYDDKEHSRHTLFSGTQVLQTRYYGHEKVYAVVVRTSFLTAKGSLVRSILFPPPVDFKFERDSYKFVQLLAFIAAIGVIYTIILKALMNKPIGEITLEALDLVTIVVPPALPAAMTVGRIYAQSRLEKANVFCISPRSINVSGSINCICFDKTGTLTEDGLDMWGVVPVANDKFDIPERDVMRIDSNSHFIKAMVTCHSLTMIDGNLAGDPLDLKMFESTGWVLEEPEVSDEIKYDLITPTIVKPGNVKSSNFNEDGDLEMGVLGLEVGIVRQYPFSSSFQRMSVVTRCLGDHKFVIYSKGSPEMIASLCNPSTIPADFESVLEEYTQEGYRVLGLAYKELSPKVTVAKVHRLSRTDAESDLTYLGLVVLENRLKPETTGILATLSSARLRTIMVTGDNMLTALSVARDCGIIPAGQAVITVTASLRSSPNATPSLHFAHQTCRRLSTHSMLNNDPSQMTIAESIISFSTTTESPIKGQINGNARNSFTIDIPSDYSKETDKVNWEYSFALTGQTWAVLRDYYPDVMSKVATRGAVFARMSPDNKQQLIQELQNLGYYVAMVGDGANDCGALKAAHAGISLSEAESSVASPFTSKEPNISCIVEVVREGRVALVTSFSIFKYMAAYSLMQFASVIILYSMNSNLTDIQFLYIDLFIITVFAFVLGRVESLKGPLYPKPPQSSLISFAPIVSLISQMVLAISCQLFSFHYVRHQPWYHHINETTAGISEGTATAGYENYSVFAVSSLQYIILAMVFSQGPPYRKSVFHSPVLITSTVVITSFTVYLIVYPAEWLTKIFETTLPPDVEFRVTMTMIGLLNLILAYTIEYGCTVLDQLKNKIREGPVAEYVRLDRAMRDSFDWPKICLTMPPHEQTLSEVSVLQPKPTVTATVSPSNGTLIHPVGSDTNLDELKFSTPLKSNLCLKTPSTSNLGTKYQSEDSLSKYLTPPSSPVNSPSLSPLYES